MGVKTLDRPWSVNCLHSTWLDPGLEHLIHNDLPKQRFVFLLACLWQVKIAVSSLLSTGRNAQSDHECFLATDPGTAPSNERPFWSIALRRHWLPCSC